MSPEGAAARRGSARWRGLLTSFALHALAVVAVADRHVGPEVVARAAAAPWADDRAVAITVRARAEPDDALPPIPPPAPSVPLRPTTEFLTAPDDAPLAARARAAAAPAAELCDAAPPAIEPWRVREPRLSGGAAGGRRGDGRAEGAAPGAPLAGSIGVGGGSGYGTGVPGDGLGSGGGGTGSGTGGAGDGSGDGDGGEGAASQGGATRGPVAQDTLAPPVYPSRARAKGWEGVVLLRLAIDAAGRVTSAVVEESSGRDALDAAALEAARGWTFSPALRDGRSVDGAMLVPVRFALTD